MHIKTTVRYHFLPTSLAVSGQTDNNSVGKDVEKLEPSYVADVDAEECATLEKPFDGFSS